MEKRDTKKALGENKSRTVNRANEDFASILSSVEVNPHINIEEPPVAIEVYSAESVAPSFTLGNFSMVIGKAKSKKTFLLTGLAASAVSGGFKIGVLKGTLPEGKFKVLYFDTEQSEYHLNKTIKRVLVQAENLSNFKAFGLRKFNASERLALIEFAIYNTPNLGVVFIDGLRDLLSKGINDEEEATSITSKMLRWTAELNIHIVVVLHQNKGDLNARGHIGTECLNKAETTISVTADSHNMNYSIVSCEQCRDISFDNFSFFINDQGLPEYSSRVQFTSSTVATNPEQIDDDAHMSVLEQIYEENSSYNYADIMQSVKKSYETTLGDNKCRVFINYFLEKGWLEKESTGKSVSYTYNRPMQES